MVGRGPEGNDIVYFGAGNGLLYALEAADGSLRWSYDTTPEDPELGDLNDLNGRFWQPILECRCRLSPHRSESDYCNVL